MPVPASYNDLTTERYIRDHVGVVYYDRTFFVPANWDAGSSRVWMRFGSVHYAAKVVSTRSAGQPYPAHQRLYQVQDGGRSWILLAM